MSTDGMRKSGIVPWTVGAEDAVCVVGVQGTVTALDREAGTITIAGHTLPTVLGNGVRLLSMTFEGAEGDGDCPAEHLDDHVCDDESERVLEHLLDSFAKVHADEHAGAFRFCDHPFCRIANGGAL